MTAVREGEPADEILSYADKEDVDVIVAGTHGRSGIRRHLIGSVAERLVPSRHLPDDDGPTPGVGRDRRGRGPHAGAGRAGARQEGHERTVIAVERQVNVWVADAETADGSLVVYVDPVSQRTSVVERH